MTDRGPLRWPLILSLSLSGVVFGLLTIAGWIHGWEGPIALVVFAVVAITVALKVPGRPFVHGFLAGFLAALVAIELQALFLSIYFTNNPGYAEIEIPFGLPARFATAVLGPINALLGGILTATIAWLGFRLIRRRTSLPAQPGPAPESSE